MPQPQDENRRVGDFVADFIFASHYSANFARRICIEPFSESGKFDELKRRLTKALKHPCGGIRRDVGEEVMDSDQIGARSRHPDDLHWPVSRREVAAANLSKGCRPMP